MKNIMITLALLLMSFGSQAGLIKWTGTGSSDSSVWTATVFVEIDMADVLPATNLIDVVVNFGMTWTDGVTTLSANSADGRTLMNSFDGGYFGVDSSLNVTQSIICSNPCNGLTPGSPDFAAVTDTGSNYWNASTTDNGDCCVLDIDTTTFMWHAPTTNAVPAPSSLALLSIAVLFIGRLRKKEEEL